MATIPVVPGGLEDTGARPPGVPEGFVETSPGTWHAPEQVELLAPPPPPPPPPPLPIPTEALRAAMRPDVYASPIAALGALVGGVTTPPAPPPPPLLLRVTDREPKVRFVPPPLPLRPPLAPVMDPYEASMAASFAAYPPPSLPLPYGPEEFYEGPPGMRPEIVVGARGLPRVDVSVGPSSLWGLRPSGRVLGITGLGEGRVVPTKVVSALRPPLTPEQQAMSELLSARSIGVAVPRVRLGGGYFPGGLAPRPVLRRGTPLEAALSGGLRLLAETQRLKEEALRDPEMLAEAMGKAPGAGAEIYTREVGRLEEDVASFEEEWAPYLRPASSDYGRHAVGEQVFVGTPEQHRRYLGEAVDLGSREAALGAAYVSVSVPIKAATSKIEGAGGLFRGMLFGGVTAREARLAGYSEEDIEALGEYKEEYLPAKGREAYFAAAEPRPSGWQTLEDPIGGLRRLWGKVTGPGAETYESSVTVLTGKLMEEHPELSYGEALRLSTGIVGRQEEGLRPKTRLEEFLTITPAGAQPGTGMGIPGAELQRTWPKLSPIEKVVGVGTTALAYSPFLAGRALGAGRGLARAWRGTGLAEKVATEPMYVMEPGTGILTKLEPALGKGFYTREGLPPLTQWSPRAGMYPAFGAKMAPAGPLEEAVGTVPIWQRGVRVTGQRPTLVTEGPVGAEAFPMVRPLVGGEPAGTFGITGYGVRAPAGGALRPTTGPFPQLAYGDRPMFATMSPEAPYWAAPGVGPGVGPIGGGPTPTELLMARYKPLTSAQLAEIRAVQARIAAEPKPWEFPRASLAGLTSAALMVSPLTAEVRTTMIPGAALMPSPAPSRGPGIAPPSPRPGAPLWPQPYPETVPSPIIEPRRAPGQAPFPIIEPITRPALVPYVDPVPAPEALPDVVPAPAPYLGLAPAPVTEPALVPVEEPAPYPELFPQPFPYPSPIPRLVPIGVVPTTPTPTPTPERGLVPPVGLPWLWPGGFADIGRGRRPTRKPGLRGGLGEWVALGMYISAPHPLERRVVGKRVGARRKKYGAVKPRRAGTVGTRFDGGASGTVGKFYKPVYA